MAEIDAYILDNSVISSLYAVDWFEALSNWRPERKLLAPESIWSEFEAHFDSEKPDWLDLREPDLETPMVQFPGVLSVPDWACIILAEEVEHACVVTNDRAIRQTANRRDLMYQWGTVLVLNTFHQCYITEDDLTEGLESYANDLGLGHGVRQELKSAEK